MSSTKVISVRNVNDALSEGLEYLLKHGVEAPSRNGTVIVAPNPVMTEYEKPCERVLFSLVRKANPFFHLMEALWMLSGRNDIGFPCMFNKNFINYSDDGAFQHGAYGHRWRAAFGHDQLDWIVSELINRPTSRRAVLAMWDGGADPLMVRKNGVDVPCNTHAYFDIQNGCLNMTVCNRSNDVIWGAYGANAVHFSILQEYLATRLGVVVGVYRQMSNNFHVYTDVYPRRTLEAMAAESRELNYYASQTLPVRPYPLMEANNTGAWDAQVRAFINNPSLVRGNLSDLFFSRVAYHVYKAWYDRKTGNGNGLDSAAAIEAKDWRLACIQWIQQTDAAKKDGGANDK